MQMKQDERPSLVSDGERQTQWRVKAMDFPVESGDQRYRFEEEKKNVFFRA